MNQNFRLSDEEYAKVVAYASRRNQTPETLFLSWLHQVTHLSKDDDPGQADRHADRHDEYLAATHMEDHAD